MFCIVYSYKLDIAIRGVVVVVVVVIVIFVVVVVVVVFLLFEIMILVTAYIFGNHTHLPPI